LEGNALDGDGKRDFLAATEMVAINACQRLPPVLRDFFCGDAYNTLLFPVPDREGDRVVVSLRLVFVERKREFLWKLDAYPLPA
jgi:hypothetical protein